MSRLNIRTLLLELTRQCNLSCAHCFRGDSQNKYMSLDTIDTIFSDISRVNSLLLTGGEPLLAINQIKKITDIIKDDKMNIGEFIIVTNGTVLSDELINMFFILSERTDFQIRISNDKFHELELENNNLSTIKEKNVNFLKQYFDVEEKLPDDKYYIVDRVGRASNLTEDDINHINKYGDNSTKYILGNNKILDRFRDQYPLPRLLEDNVVDGTVNIDVYGNITPTYYSFDEEDKNIAASIKKSKTLTMAINNINTTQD